MTDSLENLQKLCKNNKSFAEIVEIIKKARTNPPKQGHYHHIIPASWYKIHDFRVDSRHSNLVYVSVEDHYKLHLLLSECMLDEEMRYRMRYAAFGLKGCINNKQNTTNNVIKTKKVHIIKNTTNFKGKWKRFLNNHIENIKKIPVQNDRLLYLSKLKPQIEYQVLRRIIENTHDYKTAHELVKKLRKNKLSKIEVLAFL